MRQEGYDCYGLTPLTACSKKLCATPVSFNLSDVECEELVDLEAPCQQPINCHCLEDPFIILFRELNILEWFGVLSVFACVIGVGMKGTTNN